MKWTNVMIVVALIAAAAAGVLVLLDDDGPAPRDDGPDAYPVVPVVPDEGDDFPVGMMHSISYVPNGGTLPDDAPSHYMQGQDRALPIPARDGHVFTGWYLDPGLSDRVSGTSGLTGDIVLYAGWLCPMEGRVVLDGSLTLESLGFADAGITDIDGNPVDADPSSLPMGRYTASKEVDGTAYTLDFVVDGTSVFDHSWSYEGEEYRVFVELGYADTHAYIWDHPYDGREPEDGDQLSVLLTDDDPAVRQLAIQLMAQCPHDDPYVMANFILDFVRSIEYASDSVQYGVYDYYAYPAELLWNGAGDHEDWAILCTLLMSQAGFDSLMGVYLYSTYYTFVALPLEDDSGLVYLTDGDGNRYYVCDMYGEPVGSYSLWSDKPDPDSLRFMCLVTASEDPATGYGVVFYETYGGALPDGPVSTYPLGTDPGIPAPSMDGHAFAGWYLDAEFTVPLEELPRAATLHALWDPAVYGVSYELDGGTVDSELPSLYVAGTGPAMPSVSKEGYVFTGWYLDPGLEQAAGDPSLLEGHIVLHAGLEPVVYTISYDTDGGAFAEAPPTAFTVESHFMLPEPVRDGHVFGGWYLDEGLTLPVVYAGPEAGDMSLHAAWTLPDLAGTSVVLAMESDGASITCTYTYVAYIDGMYLVETVIEYTVTGEDGTVLTGSESTSGMQPTKLVGDDWYYLGAETVEGYPCTVWREPNGQICHVYMMAIPIAMEADHALILDRFVEHDDGSAFRLDVYADHPLEVSGSVDLVAGGTASFSVSGEGFVGWYLNDVPVGEGTSITLEDVNPFMRLEARTQGDVLIVDDAGELDDARLSGASVYDVDWNPLDMSVSDLPMGVYRLSYDTDGVSYRLMVLIDEERVFDHTWTYRGSEYSVSIPVRYSDFALDILDAGEDRHSRDIIFWLDITPLMEGIVGTLYGMSPDRDMRGFAEFCLGFVQSIDDLDDTETVGMSGYWMFPSEYLWYGGGDRTDSIVFYGCMMAVAGYDYIISQYGTKSGITLHLEDDAGMDRFTEDGVPFYMVDTVEEGHPIGDVDFSFSSRDFIFSSMLIGTDTPAIGSWIVYFADGGTMPDDAFHTCFPDSPAELPVPSRDGCVFTGWYTDPELTVRVSGTSGFSGCTVLYAGWAEQNDITYVLNGGHFDREPVTSYTGGTTVFLTEPVRDGFYFGGWFLDEGFTQPVVTVGDGDGDVTVYAAWVGKDWSGIELTYRLHYDDLYEETQSFFWYDDDKTYYERVIIEADTGDIIFSNPFYFEGKRIDLDGCVFLRTETVNGYPCTVWDCGHTLRYMYMMTIAVKEINQNGTGHWRELIGMVEPEFGEPVDPVINSWYPVTVSGDIGSETGEYVTLTAEGEDFDGWYLNGYYITDERTITFRLFPGLLVDAFPSYSGPIFLHDDITLESLGFTDPEVYTIDGVYVEDIDNLEPKEYIAIKYSDGVCYVLYFEPDCIRTFEHTWTYKGEEYSVSVDLHYKDIRDYVNGHPIDDDRNPVDSDHFSVYHTVDDPVIQDIAFQLMSQGADPDPYARADFILGFVQSLPYMNDSELYGALLYCAYPLETLWNDGGDDLNKAVLCTTLMAVAGFDAGLGYNDYFYDYYTLVALELDDDTGLEYLDAYGSRYYVCAAYEDASSVGEVNDMFFDVESLDMCFECPATGFSDGFVLLGYETYGGVLTDDAPMLFPAGTSVDLPVPVLDGHTFMGWCLDERYTSTVDDTSGLKGTVLLHASWDPAEYTLSYDLHGGVPEGDLPELFSPATPVELPTANRDGYTFTGWHLGSEQGPVVTSTSDLDGHSVLHAGWEGDEYAITYILNGGSFDGEPPVSYRNGDALTLPEPSRDGYVFGGWFLDADLTEPIVVVRPGSHGDVTAYAAWVTGFAPGTVLTWDGIAFSDYGWFYAEVSHSYIEESDGMLLMQETIKRRGTSVSHYVPMMTAETDWVTFGEVVGDGWEFKRTETVNGYPCTVWGYDGDTYWIHMMTLVVRFEDATSRMMNLVNMRTSAEGESMVLDVTADSTLTVSGSVDVTVGGEATFSVEGEGFTGWYLNGIPLGTERTVTLEDINPAMVLEARADDAILEILSLDELPEGWGVGEAEFTDILGYAVADISQAGPGEYRSVRTSDGVEYCLRFFIDEVHTFDHTWTYGGEEYRLTIDVGYSDFIYERRGLSSKPFHMNVLDHYLTVDDPLMAEVARMLYSMFPGDDRNGFADFMLDFVQSIPYTLEYEIGSDYWMLPVEYLWYGAGDCEDSSIFHSTLMAVCGYDTMFLDFGDHAMSAVSIDLVDDTGLVYMTDGDGTRYYFCETTSGSRPIGSSSEDYRPETCIHHLVVDASQPSPVVGYWIQYVTSGGEMPDDAAHTYMPGSVFTLPVPTIEGHVFTGWYLDPERTLPMHDPSAITGNTVLYAGWDPQVYSLTYHTDYGTFAEDPPRYYAMGSDEPLPVPYIEHNVFAGWYLDPERLTPVESTADLSGDVHLYDSWEIPMHSITYESLGYLDEPLQPYYIEGVPLELPTMQLPGYIFGGWFTDTAGEQPVVVVDGFTEDLVLYGGWHDTSLGQGYLLEYRYTSEDSEVVRGMVTKTYHAIHDGMVYVEETREFIMSSGWFQVETEYYWQPLGVPDDWTYVGTEAVNVFMCTVWFDGEEYHWMYQMLYELKTSSIPESGSGSWSIQFANMDRLDEEDLLDPPYLPGEEPVTE